MFHPFQLAAEPGVLMGALSAGQRGLCEAMRSRELCAEEQGSSLNPAAPVRYPMNISGAC